MNRRPLHRDLDLGNTERPAAPPPPPPATEPPQPETEREMESLQAPHQEHDPRHQAQETWTQTYQIYADTARPGTSRRPTETPPTAGPDPRGQTYEGEGRRR